MPMTKWFSIHDEVVWDDTVQRLSGDEFKMWVNLLCVANKNGGGLPGLKAVAFALRRDRASASLALQKFRELGLILLSEDGTLRPFKWVMYDANRSTGIAISGPGA